MLKDRSKEYLMGFYAALSHMEDFFPKSSKHGAAVEIDKRKAEVAYMLQELKMQQVLKGTEDKRTVRSKASKT